MNFYGNYKSPLGYQTGENQIDTYGVDHSGFSTRDELEYQFARQNKENQLIQNYNNQGITKNYPQQGTNFWGNSDNNYGFGSSNIHDNIENRNNNPFENTVNTFGQSQTEQSYGLGNNNQNQSVWNKKQYQTPTPWAKQSTSLGRNQPVPNKPVYENPNPKGYSAGNIAWSALEGFGEGIENGSLALFNAGTGGLYDLASYTFMDDDYAKRQNKMQRQAEDVGLGVANKLANYAIDAGGTSKILKSLGIIK